jgi:hypothetical protein
VESEAEEAVAEEERYSDEVLDEAIAAAEQPELPEGTEEEQVAEDALEDAVGTDAQPEESQER